MDSPRKGNPKQIFSKANLVVLHSPAACPLEGEVVVKRSTWRQAGRGAGGSSRWGWGGPALEGVLILEWLRAGPAPEWLGVQALFSHAHPKSGPPPAMLEIRLLPEVAPRSVCGKETPGALWSCSGPVQDWQGALGADPMGVRLGVHLLGEGP